MVDVTLPVDVTAGSNAKTRQVTAGETVVGGRCLHLAADAKHDYADADASATTAAVTGITIGGAADAQHVELLYDGDLENCSGLTKGVHYTLADSAGAGLLMPVADQAGSDWVTGIGIAKSTTVLSVKINATGVQQ